MSDLNKIEMISQPNVSVFCMSEVGIKIFSKMNIIRRILMLSLVSLTILSCFAATLYVDFVGEYSVRSLTGTQ